MGYRESPESQVEYRWWANKDGNTGKRARDDVHETLLGVVRKIRDNLSDRREMDLHHARLYGDMRIAGLGLDTYSKGYSPSKLGFNVVKQCCDTLVSKIAKSRPLAMFLTNGGTEREKGTAQAMNKFSEAQFSESNVFQETRGSALDACVYGIGVVKNYIDYAEEKIVCERVYPFELMVDECEAQYGKPRNLYHRKWIDRRVLAEIFPKKRDQILSNTRSGADPDENPPDTTADQVLVTEAWHLPSGVKARDGRHSIVCDGCTFLDEPYTKDYFPFSFLYVMPPAMGFYGIGIAQVLTGLQFEINFTAMRIQRAHRLMGGAHWAIHRNEALPNSHITNDFGNIWRYSVTKPDAVVVPPVHADVYRYLEMLVSKAFEISGISQLSAQSQKPAGLNSGKALQTYNDIETERFMMFGKSWEEFHLDIAKQQIDLVKEMMVKVPGYVARYRGNGTIEEIRAADFADLGDTDYVMQAFPVSALSKTPEGRMAQVQELAKAGWISQQDAKRLLDFPDLDKLNSIQFAPYEVIDEVIEDMLRGGPYQPPEPLMDLEYAKSRAITYYLQARKNRNENEEDLEKLRKFARQCHQYIQSTAAAVAAQQPTQPQPQPQPAV